MKLFTFDQIPIIMNKLHDKLEHLERLILSINITEEKKDKLLNVEEASKFLNLSVATIYSKVCNKEIPVNKKKKRIYFCHHELMQWINSGRIKTYIKMKNNIDKSQNYKFIT